MKKQRTVLLSAIILTLAFIWGNSLLSREQSSGESAWVLQLVTPFLELFAGKGNVTEHLVRKLAHFTEFALLGLELLFWFSQKRGKKKEALLLAMAHGLFAALTDETIQLFSGRGSQVQDVWLDFAGVTAGALTALLLTLLIRKKQTAEPDFSQQAEKFN
jgi:VanZ family protein